MKFIVIGTQVYCLRTTGSVSLAQALEDAVVSFDAHLCTIAPHVAAALRPGEHAELKAWLRERESIKKSSPDGALVASLSRLLEPAAAAIARGIELDRATLERMRQGIEALEVALAGVVPDSARISRQVDVMDNSEALRHHLEVLRQAL